jgi:hypothetical protein
MDPLKFALYPL